MAKYLMLGKYSVEAVKNISSDRTKKVVEIIEKEGGKAEKMYVLIGNYDLAFIADFPGTKELLRASIAITKLTGIGFSSLPAVSVEEFDKAVG
ncbi:MAG: GYD domain-containing protein [Candidatus Omnitrophota bacterium]